MIALLFWSILLTADQSNASSNAKQELQAHHYQQAIALADAGIRRQPQDLQLWFVRALAYGALGETTRSLSNFDHVLSQSPDAVPVLEAAAQVAYTAHDARARVYLARILQVAPHQPVASGMAGVLAFEGHDCPAALAYFGDAGDLVQTNGAAAMEMGSCLAQQGSLDEASRLFDQLAAATPANPTLAYDAALLHYRNKQYAQAIAALEKLRTTQSLLDGDTLNLLAAAYADSGEIQQAVNTYRAEAEANPHDLRAYIDLASLSVEHQSYQTAIDVLDAGLRSNPNAAQLYAMRGAVHAQRAENDAAAADFLKASTLAPSRLYGTVGLGTLLRDTSKLPQAERLLRGRLASSPHDGVLHYLLADVLLRMGAEPNDTRFQEAHRLLQQAVSLAPDLAPAQGELGKMDLQLGRVDQAIRELETGLHYDPTDRTSLMQLVAAYRKAGRAEDAAQTATKLAHVVDQERNEEARRNRVLLTVDASTRPQPAASTSGSAGAQRQ